MASQEKFSNVRGESDREILSPLLFLLAAKLLQVLVN
jgi:hypothetical protein